jgi:hypothetical protein
VLGPLGGLALHLLLEVLQPMLEPGGRCGAAAARKQRCLVPSAASSVTPACPDTLHPDFPCLPTRFFRARSLVQGGREAGSSSDTICSRVGVNAALVCPMCSRQPGHPEVTRHWWPAVAVGVAWLLNIPLYALAVFGLLQVGPHCLSGQSYLDVLTTLRSRMCERARDCYVVLDACMVTEPMMCCDDTSRRA